MIDELIDNFGGGGQTELHREHLHEPRVAVTAKRNRMTVPFRHDVNRQRAGVSLSSFRARECYHLGVAKLGETVMPATPLIVHKVHDNSNSNAVNAGDGFSDLQLDAIAAALAGLRDDIRAEMQAAIATAVAQLRDENDLTETVAQLRGQVSVLLNLIGGNGNDNNLKLFEASETVRKLTVQGPSKRRMRQAKVMNQNGSPVRP